MRLIIVFFIIIQTINAFELYSVRKQLLKEGLHRELLTNTSYRIDNPVEMDSCHLIFIENVTKDTYIYLEEMKKLKGFTFWPHYPMDIEKPASESKS